MKGNPHGNPHAACEEEIATLRAQLAEAQAENERLKARLRQDGLEQLSPRPFREDQEDINALTTIEQIAQGLADEYRGVLHYGREWVQGGALAQFDAYQQRKQKGTPLLTE